MPNQTPRHDEVWGSGSIAPLILNLSTRWRWEDCFTPRPLYLRERTPPPPTHWTGVWVGPRASVDTEVAKRKKSLPCQAGNRSPIVQAADCQPVNHGDIAMLRCGGVGVCN